MWRRGGVKGEEEGREGNSQFGCASEVFHVESVRWALSSEKRAKGS